MAAPPRGVTEAVISGWPGLRLTTDALSVTVLPGKGADIYELTDLATGVDPLFKAPWGLQPPGAPPREGSDGAAFLENYEGSWQELFPNTNDACRLRRRAAPVPRRGGGAALVGVRRGRRRPGDRGPPLGRLPPAPAAAGAAHAAAPRRARAGSRRAGHQPVAGGGPVHLGAPLRARRRRWSRPGPSCARLPPRSSRRRSPGRTPPAWSPASAAPGRWPGCARAARPTCRGCRGRRRAATTTST